MEEAKSMAQHHHQQQQQFMLQKHNQNPQQQQQQQMMLIQQQKLLQQQNQQQQMLFIQQQQQAAISRFPSNIDAHLRPTNLNRQNHLQQQQQQVHHQNPNPIIPNSQNQQQLHQNSTLNARQQQHQQQLLRHLHQQQQQKAIRPAGNQLELQMAYQDAWRVCHPDFKQPFSSLEDACERLLPYHVVADYEAEEDDKLLDSDSTGQMSSRSQQWDHNIAAKVAEFLVTFEKQALAFNIISRKRSAGEFRCEERLMIEQALLQEEKRAMLELRAEIDSREKAKLRMEAMAHAESRAEMMARGPIRANAAGSRGISNVSVGRGDIAEHHDEGINHQDGMINGWGTNVAPRDEKEPCEDFLNDEENENDDACNQDEWRDGGEFDLNTT